MISFYYLIFATTAVSGAFAVPTNTKKGLGLLARGGTPSATGTSNGFYYSWWTDGGSQATYTNGAAGQYTLTWSGNGNLIGGKGWNPGSNRTINYSGTYQPNGTSYLSVYGWKPNPIIEYYIVESYGSYNPSSSSEGQKKGSVICDGATYDIHQITRVSHIEGNAVLKQYWSVRNPKKAPGGEISGSVSTGCHFNAWAKVGMNLGDQDYTQIVATEGYFSNGTATITVS